MMMARFLGSGGRQLNQTPASSIPPGRHRPAGQPVHRPSGQASGSTPGGKCARCSPRSPAPPPSRDPGRDQAPAVTVKHGPGRSCHNSPLSAAALVLQVLDRGPHLVSVPRRPVVGFRQPRHPGVPARGDQLDRKMLRAVVVAQYQEPHRQGDRRKLVHARTQSKQEWRGEPAPKKWLMWRVDAGPPPTWRTPTL